MLLPDKMFMLFFVALQEITGLHHRISLPFSPHVHTIPGYGFSYCSSTVSDLSHFTALKAGEWLSKPMLSETTKMFVNALQKASIDGAPLHRVNSNVHLKVIFINEHSLHLKTFAGTGEPVWLSVHVSTLRIWLFLSNTKSKETHFQRSVSADHPWQVRTTIVQSATHQNDKNDTDLSPVQR